MSESPSANGLNESRACFADDLDPEELAFQARYGPWAAYTPPQAKDVFDATGLTWWVAGGWAIEAFTRVSRDHEDIDVSMWRRDVRALVEVFRSRFHVWAAAEGSLCPLYDERLDVPENADQVWIREHALSPWRADVLLNPDRDGRWVSRRDREFDAPLDEVTWEHEGIRYLNPEIVLAFKAKHSRPKDQRDLEATLPLLDSRARAWLADYLARKEPEHAWRERF